MLKRFAKRNRAVRLILSHAHALQIVDDHHVMWAEAADDAERESIRARCYHQLWLAAGHAVGFEVAAHGVVAFFFNPMMGGALLVLGAAIIYFTDRGH